MGQACASVKGENSRSLILLAQVPRAQFVYLALDLAFQASSAPGFLNVQDMNGSWPLRS